MRAGAMVAALFLAGGGSPPHLVVGVGSPVVVQGTGFKSHERVSVLLVGARSWNRRVVADARGAFAVRFTVPAAACDGYLAHAFGSLGSRARSLPMPRTACSAPTG